MTIWVDADACPKPVKEMLYRAANRTKTALILVANQALYAPKSAYIRTIQVAQGFDVADNYIVQHVQAGDLVITSDIPLAAEVLEKGAQAFNTRGEVFDRNNIGAKRDMRDFMDTMRSSGIHTGGPAPFSQADRQQFAQQLDRFLANNTKK